ncbi:MAG: 30S ribosomal protein S6 [Bacteroidia bacterium]|nr:30S ribosomal protein S6 [Bacteroidia bacterium]
MDIKPKSFQNEYETTFIVNPDLPGDEHKKAVDKFVKLIEDNGGTIHNVERWGVRRMAYSINRHRSGYYAYIEFRGNAEFIEKLEQNYRYDEQIIRYLTVKLDKHAVAFNNKRRELGFGLRKEVTKVSE